MPGQLPLVANRTMGTALVWLSVAATAVAAFVALSGGFRVEIGGIRLSMHDVTRPVAAALVFGAAGFYHLRGRVGGRIAAIGDVVLREGWLLAIGFALLIGLVTFILGAHIAGSADASGYLSQARLWRSGALRLDTPLARELTVAHGPYAFTPLGYQPAPSAAAAVPSYPPGLPLLMAAAAAIGGEGAEFIVVPSSTAGVVLVVFAIGRRLGGTEAGLLAAAATGASPILLFQAMQPMSDVPAAFFWTLAVWLLTRDGPATTALAGAAAAAACVIRPNLFVVTPVLAVLWAWWHSPRPRLRDAILFAAPIALAAAGIAASHYWLFGRVTQSGYGAIPGLFAASHAWPNLARYPRWAVYAQSALIFAALAAPIAIRRGWVTPSIERRRATALAWSGLLCAAVLQAFYLFYLVFDGWVSFRFMLPALPWLLALQATVIAAACRRLPEKAQGFALVLLAVLAASWGAGHARALGAFRLVDSEQRYLDVARFVRRLAPGIVVLTVQHSGSVSYYTHAAVLRWDWIEPDELDRAVSVLSHSGRPMVAVIEEWEEPEFRRRFAGTATLLRRGAPLLAAGGPPGITTYVYPITGTTTAAAAVPFSW